jgi:uncharacterized protein (DUF4415 family)
MNTSKSLIGTDGEVGELDDKFFKTAKRGRPPMPAELRKKRVDMMLDPDVLAYFKSSGKGWQTRINAALREAAGLSR